MDRKQVEKIANYLDGLLTARAYKFDEMYADGDITKSELKDEMKKIKLASKFLKSLIEYY